MSHPNIFNLPPAKRISRTRESDQNNPKIRHILPDENQMTRILQDENQPLNTIYNPIQSQLKFQVDDYKNKLKKVVNARDSQKQKFRVKQNEILLKNKNHFSFGARKRTV